MWMGDQKYQQTNCFRTMKNICVSCMWLLVIFNLTTPDLPDKQSPCLWFLRTSILRNIRTVFWLEFCVLLNYNLWNQIRFLWYNVKLLCILVVKNVCEVWFIGIMWYCTACCMQGWQESSLSPSPAAADLSKDIPASCIVLMSLLHQLPLPHAFQMDTMCDAKYT